MRLDPIALEQATAALKEFEGDHPATPFDDADSRAALVVRAYFSALLGLPEQSRVQGQGSMPEDGEDSTGGSMS